jgi:hypothetical protein
MQDSKKNDENKRKKNSVKVADLKPSKDPKGGEIIITKPTDKPS